MTLEPNVQAQELNLQTIRELPETFAAAVGTIELAQSLVQVRTAYQIIPWDDACPWELMPAALDMHTPTGSICAGLQLPEPVSKLCLLTLGSVN